MMATYCMRDYGAGAEGLDEDTARCNAANVKAFGHLTCEAWHVLDLLRRNDRSPESLPAPVRSAVASGAMEFRCRSVVVKETSGDTDVPMHDWLLMRSDGTFTGCEEDRFTRHLTPLKLGHTEVESD